MGSLEFAKEPSISVSTQKGRKRALVVGISKYEDAQINELHFTARDAETVAQTLREYCAFDEVRLLHTGGECEPRSTAILDALSEFRQELGKDDLFLFYFGGHGVHVSEHGYLLTSDSRIDWLGRTSVALDDLRQAFSRFQCANRVLIVDACRNDPMKAKGDTDNVLTSEFARDVKAVATTGTEAATPAGCVLFSCLEGQRSWEWYHREHGVFTYFLVEGMKQMAWSDQGILTAEGLARYVEREVAEWALREGREQRPWFVKEGLDDPVLAVRNPELLHQLSCETHRQETEMARRSAETAKELHRAEREFKETQDRLRRKEEELKKSEEAKRRYEEGRHTDEQSIAALDAEVRKLQEEAHAIERSNAQKLARLEEAQRAGELARKKSEEVRQRQIKIDVLLGDTDACFQSTREETQANLAKARALSYSQSTKSSELKDMGPKAAKSLAIFVLVMILGVPILAGLKKGAAGGGGAESGPPAPYWNASNLPGTVWEVNSPQGIVTVTFREGGIAEAAHPVVQQFLNQPYITGSWNVAGDKLNISASVPPPINQSISISVDIEGEELVGTMEGQRMSARRVR